MAGKKAAEKTAPEKSGEAAAVGDTPKKRSKLKLMLFVLAPLLVLGGGGYAGWLFFLAPGSDGHGEASAEAGQDGHAKEGEHAADAGHGEEGGEGEADQIHVAAVDYSITAEISFTYTFALSEMLAPMCGRVDTAALKAEMEKEAHADGMLVNMSWMAANRRMGTITEESCSMMLAEVMNADGRAWSKQQEAAKPAKAAAH